MRPFRAKFVPLLLAALAAVCPPVAAQPEQASVARPAEYMIYQYPRVSLVVVIDARETEFDTRIKGPEGVLVNEAAIAARRIGPVYQFVDAVDIPRQLMIEVNPAQPVERSRISMELLQLPESDRNARALSRAYRFLAHGMKRVYTDTTATWTERAYSLRNAANAFAAMGMEEMRLWSEYYAAHLILHEIGDVLLSLERAQALQTAAARAGFEAIGLAAATLEAEALMMAGEKSVAEQSFGRYDAAHGAWERVIRMAEEQGFQAEHGRALYRDGIAWERQGQLDRAIGRYEQALEVTASAADPDLLNQVRATAAAAYESRGSTSGAISLLDDIAGDLSGGEESAAQELARNLHEKGRLLNGTYRYAAAEADLQQALELQKRDPAAGQWGLTGLQLGRAKYALGYLEAAESVLLESLPRTPAAEKDARAAAYGLLASIAREQRRFGPMAEYRAQQDRLLSEGSLRASFLFESALDALERDGPGSGTATGLLREARGAATGGDLVTGHRAALYLCLVELQGRGSSACDPEHVRGSQHALRRSGIPAVEVDAGLAWAKVLLLAGDVAGARGQADRVVDRVQFYRERLPGVVAPWYAARREALFHLYLDLARRTSGERLLLALDRLRRMDRVVVDGAAPEDAIRGQIARVDAAQPAPGDELSAQVHESLTAFRESSGWSSGALTSAGLRNALGSLGRDETLLAYSFLDPGLYAVTATRKGVKLHSLSNLRQVRGRLESVRSTLQDPAAGDPDGDLNALGRLLLPGVAGELGETVYLLPSGPLNGFPFDALRLEGRYLAESRRVINLDTIAALGSPRELLPGDFGSRVFLAGNPRSGRDLFSYGVSSSSEIAAVRDRFVGDGLHIVQGVALRSDEFDDERYHSASLVHLAMPGRVERAHPERSRLLLSGERESPTAEFLSPVQLRGFGLQAELAVLSGTVVTGDPGTDYDSRVGLVSDLHAAGARRVVASLWPAGNEETAHFMGDFYRALDAEREVAVALFRARQSRITAKSDTNIRMWAGFQLFIR